MINTKKFIKNHVALCICSLSIIVLGYLGYRTVFWVINKCSKTRKIVDIYRKIFNSSQKRSDTTKNLSKDYWWIKITNTEEFNRFRKNLPKLTRSSSAREEEVQALKSSYYQLSSYSKASHQFTYASHQSIYNALLGTVYATAGNFSMWMPGVALVAAYLSEKKKVEGLYVCETVESLSSQIKKISLNPENQRYAFVVGTCKSGYKRRNSIGIGPNFPQHKAAVCVEKKDEKLTIALLDAQPVDGNKNIRANHLNSSLWSGYDKLYEFNCQELLVRAILKGCRESKCNARLLYSQVIRETSYGCGVFALQDALAYLRDPEFFSRIKCSKEKPIKIDETYEIEAITTLPSEYMVGTQSLKLMAEYKKLEGEFDKILPGKKKSLQNYLDENSVELADENGQKKIQNHYITKKSFKYLHLVFLSLKYLKPSELTKIINKTLVKQN